MKKSKSAQKTKSQAKVNLDYIESIRFKPPAKAPRNKPGRTVRANLRRFTHKIAQRTLQDLQNEPLKGVKSMVQNES